MNVTLKYKNMTESNHVDAFDIMISDERLSPITICARNPRFISVDIKYFLEMNHKALNLDDNSKEYNLINIILSDKDKLKSLNDDIGKLNDVAYDSWIEEDDIIYNTTNYIKKVFSKLTISKYRDYNAQLMDRIRYTKLADVYSDLTNNMSVNITIYGSSVKFDLVVFDMIIPLFRNIDDMSKFQSDVNDVLYQPYISKYIVNKLKDEFMSSLDYNHKMNLSAKLYKLDYEVGMYTGVNNEEHYSILDNIITNELSDAVDTVAANQTLKRKNMNNIYRAIDDMVRFKGVDDV